jgi:hypothetical protein
MPAVIAAFGPRDLAVRSKPIVPMNMDPRTKSERFCPLADEGYAGDAVAVVVAT